MYTPAPSKPGIILMYHSIADPCQFDQEPDPTPDRRP